MSLTFLIEPKVLVQCNYFEFSKIVVIFVQNKTENAIFTPMLPACHFVLVLRNAMAKQC